MRIVLLSETYSDKMGYIQNTLPKYLGALGMEVHVVTADLPPNYLLKDFAKSYKEFDGDSSWRRPGTTRAMEGFTLHVLGHRRVLGYVRMIGLREKLREIRPDIVQTTVAVGWLPLDAAMFKPGLGYKLFTGNSTTISVFPLATRPHHFWDPERIRVFFLRTIPGFLISLMATRCFPATTDCAEVAARFLGVPRKLMEVSPLGVDTDLFSPSRTEAERIARRELRGKLGFQEEDIVCIYTGRFSSDKNPLILAKAIATLTAMGERYRGLFVGNGAQADEIRGCAGCLVLRFVPFPELVHYFRASEIGVWPTQESTSMLDAAACGLPIVVNDTLKATERIEGNGLIYRLDDVGDLVRVLLSLRSADRREELGRRGAEKMAMEFSWRRIAEVRVAAYQAALAR